jgi:hypothetical protein
MARGAVSNKRHATSRERLFAEPDNGTGGDQQAGQEI